MARGRMINQAIAEDIEFNELGLEAQLIYMRTIPFLDRDGLISGHPAILFGKVAPLLLEMAAKMQAIIDEWVESGLVIRYLDGRISVLFFKGFTKNQIGLRYDREPESSYPPPPGYCRTKSGMEKIEEPIHDLPADDEEPVAGSVPPEVEGRVGELPDDCRMNAGTLPDDCRPNIREDNKIKLLPRVRTRNGNSPEGGGSGGVFALWRSEMPGPLSAVIEAEVSQMIATYGEPEVEEAIRLAAKADNRTARYVSGILRRRASEPPRPNAPPVSSAVSGNIGLNLAAI